MEQRKLQHPNIVENYQTFCLECEKMLEEIYHDNIPDDLECSVVVSGSSPFLFCNVTYRIVGTNDIDVARTERLSSEMFALFPKYDMNTGPNAFLGHLPYNYEDRLMTLYRTEHIIVYRPSWEDLAYSKLRRYEDHDIEDLSGILDMLNIGFLYFLISDEEEALGNGLTDGQYRQLLSNYCRFMMANFADYTLEHPDLIELCYDYGTLADLYVVVDEHGSMMHNGDELACFRNTDEAEVFRANFGIENTRIAGPYRFHVRNVDGIRCYELIKQ